MTNNRRRSTPRLGMFLFVVVVFVLPPTTLLLMLHFEPLVISQTGDAGIFETAASHDDLTNVRTSTGVITVSGGFSALNGQRLMLRRSNKFGLQLCQAEDLGNCAEVSGTWTGTLQSIPQPNHWYMIDFAKHQINPGPLLAILAMGVLTALAALLLVASGCADSDSAEADDQEADHARTL